MFIELISTYFNEVTMTFYAMEDCLRTAIYLEYLSDGHDTFICVTNL
jgi:hypothetical protein